MAEDMEELNVSGSTQQIKPKYPGLSPLQAGLMYGGAASTVMGPLGILVGLTAAIGAKRMKDSYLDKESTRLQNLRQEQRGIQQELDGEIAQADPDEARLLNHAKRLGADGWYRLQQGDRTGEQMIAQANAIAESIMNADSQARKQEQAQTAAFQRQLVQTSAESMRSDYQANMKMFEEVDKQTSNVLKLVASEGFDPNKPFNKAVLSDMLSVGVSGLYKDDPGGLSQLAGSIPVVGRFLQGGVEALKADDYKLTGEDFNRIALRLKEANEQYAEQRMYQLGNSASGLDEFARKIGAITGDYGIKDYVTGQVDELPYTETPKYRPPVAKKTRGPQGLFSTSPTGQRITEWMNNRDRRRPTN